MTNYTYRNHLKYTIGGRDFGYRETGFEKFSVTLGKIDSDIYKRSNYREELRRTANNVYKEFGKDLIVFLSGGTDSEIVLRNFIEIGVKPRCVTVSFIGDYNKADVVESIEISKELDVKLDIIDFDIRDFFNSGKAGEFGREIQCTQLAYLMTYYNIRQLGFPAVMGGEVLLTRQATLDSSFWYYTFRENEDASAMRFSEKYNIPLVNEWFTYTPELLLYYLEDFEIVNLVSERYNYKLSSVSTKNRILNRLVPEIRPKIKTNGFERLRAFNFEAYQVLMTEQVKRLEPSLDGIKLQEAMKMLRGE